MNLPRSDTSATGPAVAHANFTLAGAPVLADRSGAIVLLNDRTLVVADLHFEKGSAFAARGDAWLPPYDTGETLARLERVCRQYRPRRIVCLGDSFHDLDGPDRMAASDQARLRRLVQRQEWGQDRLEGQGERGWLRPGLPEHQPGAVDARWRSGERTDRGRTGSGRSRDAE